MLERGANINENEMEQISVKIQSFVCEVKKKNLIGVLSLCSTGDLTNHMISINVFHYLLTVHRHSTTHQTKCKRRHKSWRWVQTKQKHNTNNNNFNFERFSSNPTTISTGRQASLIWVEKLPEAPSVWPDTERRGVSLLLWCHTAARTPGSRRWTRSAPNGDQTVRALCRTIMTPDLAHPMYRTHREREGLYSVLDTHVVYLSVCHCLDSWRL